MVLKKQTVWLLTMLSLIVVLSVYYVTSPNQIPGDEVALVGEENQDLEAGMEQLPADTNETVVNMAEELDEAVQGRSDRRECYFKSLFRRCFCDYSHEFTGFA